MMNEKVTSNELKVSNSRLDELIWNAESREHPVFKVEVAAALRELKALRASSGHETSVNAAFDSVKEDRDKAYAALGWCTGCDSPADRCRTDGSKCCPDCSHSAQKASGDASCP